MTDEAPRRRVRELCVSHSKMSHPNLVQFFIAFEDEKAIYVATELCTVRPPACRHLRRGGTGGIKGASPLFARAAHPA